MDWNVFKKNSSIDGFGTVLAIAGKTGKWAISEYPMMKRRLIYLVVVLVMICLLPLVGIGYWGSGRLLFPERRVLQDYHMKILEDPQRFGISVLEYEALRQRLGT